MKQWYKFIKLHKEAPQWWYIMYTRKVHVHVVDIYICKYMYMYTMYKNMYMYIAHKYTSTYMYKL